MILVAATYGGVSMCGISTAAILRYAARLELVR